MTKASIRDTRYGLEHMPYEAQERALYRTTSSSDGCLDSTYMTGTPGGPQIQWKVDGEVYFMYHWRVMYYLQNGTIPARYSVFRTCRSERCVNPDHRKPRR